MAQNFGENEGGKRDSNTHSAGDQPDRAASERELVSGCHHLTFNLNHIANK
jgi:hypothetical protein